MTLIAIAVIGGVVFALVLFRLIYIVVGRAVDNAIRWAIYNFGNPDAVRRLEERDE